ncbi:RebB family R body protein [Photobacterium lipolyticum]|uniref:Glycerol-3-phosphate dehydrogenase subunit C n=1 Tax=Photobacterium lipolyticum TaxID=266810 RepID=A0A2T3MUV6_9GAMM|nr:RebB family R body protein [Photobacterium lipolyticum]PSW03696.1 glycerol-3-phosphate dehydrogenase subunit C [Photobacterium lipolyticum]
MAGKNTTVNDQITDSVTQVNTNTLASTPAMAMSNLYTAMGQALATGSHNTTMAQQQANVTMQAATVQGVNSLTSIGSAVIGRASEGVLEKDS